MSISLPSGDRPLSSIGGEKGEVRCTLDNNRAPASFASLTPSQLARSQWTR